MPELPDMPSVDGYVASINDTLDDITAASLGTVSDLADEVAP